MNSKKNAKKNAKKDAKTQIVGLTDYLIEMIPAWLSFALTLAVGAIAGMAGVALLTGSADVATGLATGLFFISAPAILGAACTTLSSMFSTKLLLRRSAYLGLFTSTIVAVLYVAGSAFHTNGLYTVLDVLIYSYVLVLAMRIFILSVACPYSFRQTAVLSLIHPLIGFAFLLNTGLLSNFFPFPVLQIGPLNVMVLAEKAIASGIVLGAGVGLFIVLLNAPMKRSFGIKSFNLAKMFISHWYHGSMAIEEFLKAIGEKVDTLIGVIAFKARNRLKAVLVVPYVHPGPFGSVGGSRIVEQLTESLEQHVGAPVAVMHGTVTHDLDPVSRESVEKTISETKKALQEIRYSPTGSCMVREQLGKAKLSAQRFGNSVLIASTFSPESTDDIDFSVGFNAMSKMKKGKETPMLVDAHNCHSSAASAVFSGDPAMFEIIDCVPKLRKKLERQSETRMRVGFSAKAFDGYRPKDGIGNEGVKALVVGAG
ncbi:DUF2070 family protein, partial [archaeon]|nr:DUF2070 family protein [archaeon]